MHTTLKRFRDLHYNRHSEYISARLDEHFGSAHQSDRRLLMLPLLLDSSSFG
jgi:hypothetical protein